MWHRGRIAVALAAVVLISGFTIAVDDHELGVKPPSVTGTVTLRSARNTDPRAKQFLDDVQREDDTWTATPGTFVEATVHWHLPRRLHSSTCQLAVHVLPEASGRLGTKSTGTIGDAAMGDDMRLKKAFDEPGPPTDLGGISYEILPAGTDGTITIVVAYSDEVGTAFDDATARASAVVECSNHEDLFKRTRNVVGSVTTLPVSTAT